MQKTDRIYLDYAATTPVDPLVRDAMLPYLEADFGNPSSLHYYGRQARKALQSARESMAQCLGTTPETVYFTSGATEANNWVVFGLAETLQDRGRHIVISSIEHPAIDNPCRSLESKGWAITRLPVDSEGFVSPADVAAALRPDTVLVSIIHGNNEIGTLQPVAEIGTLLRERGIPFHTDAVQTVGKLPFNLGELPVDYLSMSAHKIYGPKGVGILYCREGAPVPAPRIIGGGQENDWRSGTENLPGVIGMAKALSLATDKMATETPRLRALQERLIAGVLKRIPSAVLNGPRDVNLRVPGNVHFSFPPAEGESLVLHLDLKKIASSSGSACHSAVIEPSRIIMALGKSEAVARGTVRFSLGRYTTEVDIDEVLAVLPGVIQRFVKESPAAHL